MRCDYLEPKRLFTVPPNRPISASGVPGPLWQSLLRRGGSQGKGALLMPGNSGSVPVLPVELGRRGKNDAGASSIRSGGSARSKIPPSARSTTSAISMHVNSYSYLSNRVYDFLQARSAWLGRTQYEKEEGGDAALKVRGSSLFCAPRRLSGLGRVFHVLFLQPRKQCNRGEEIPTTGYNTKQ